MFFVKSFKTENKRGQQKNAAVNMLYSMLPIIKTLAGLAAASAVKGWGLVCRVLRRAARVVKPYAVRAFGAAYRATGALISAGAEKMRSSRARGILAAGTVAAAVAVIVTANAANYTAGVAVKFDGETVGYVTDANAALTVENDVQSKIYGNKMNIASMEYEETLVKRDDLSDNDELVSVVLDSMDGVKKCSALIVDGEVMGVAESRDTIEQALASLVASYTGDDFEFIGYENDLHITDIYVTEDGIEGIASSPEDFLSGKAGISVLTARIENGYDVELPYDTVVTYDDSRTSDYSKVKTKGQSGVGFISERVIYCNGKRVTSGVLYSEILQAPVNEEVVNGISTNSVRLTSGEYVPASSALGGRKGSMVFPCAVTSRTYISSFWGDGRGHRGVDIASPYGSDIYAAMDGVVTFSGTKGAYGRCIIIKHSDGLETLYSHNSRNLVKVGEIVSAGELIAKVGATGNATGNHLHFSVMINGEMVDPGSYIGLSGGSGSAKGGSQTAASADTKHDDTGSAPDDGEKAEETPAEEPVKPNKPAEEPDAGGKTETPTEEDKKSETGTGNKADGTEKETESEDKPASEEQNQEQ